MNGSPATSSAHLLARALWAPRALAVAIEEERANWRLPALVIIGTVMALDMLALPLFVRAIPQMAPVGLSPDMLGQLEQTARLMRPIQILLSPLGWLIKWAFTAVLLFGVELLLLRPATGAEGARVVPVRSFFVLVVYANLVLVLEALLKNLILWLRYLLSGAIVLDPAVGVDALVRPSDPALAVVLAHVNVFEVWFLTILIGGVAALCRCSRSRAAALVLPVWGLGLLVRVGLALVREVLTRQLSG
jgi:hypothetical protein